jgi:hypothetical protein
MTTSAELREFIKKDGRRPLVSIELALGRVNQYDYIMNDALYSPKHFNCMTPCTDHKGKYFNTKAQRAKFWGLYHTLVESRLNKGYSLEEALTKKVEKKPPSIIQTKKTISGHGRYCRGRFINNPELALTPGYMYLLLVIINDTYHLKTGITIQDISNKTKLSHHPKGSKIINRWYMPLSVCYLSEQKLLKSNFNQEIQLTMEQKFSGYSEVFTEFSLDDRSLLTSLHNFIELQLTTFLYLQADNDFDYSKESWDEIYVKYLLR